MLRELAAEADPFVTLVAGGVYEQADSFRLRLPDTVSLRRRGAGIKPRPVPDVLIDRPKSGLGVYQALSSRPRSVDELVAASQYSRATVYRRLDELAELGLARRARDGKWVRGPRGLVAASWRTGGYQLRRARLRRYGNGGRGGLGWTPGTGRPL